MLDGDIRVLSLTPDCELRSLRSEVLSQAGFQVSSPTTKAEALLEIERNHFEVLLLCYSWRVPLLQELADAFKRQNRAGCIIAITTTPWASKPLEADFAVYAIDGADALVQKIKECVQQHKAA